MSGQGKCACLTRHWLQVSILSEMWHRAVIVLTGDPGRRGTAGLSGHSQQLTLLLQLCNAHQNHRGDAATRPRQQNDPRLSPYHPWASGSGRCSGGSPSTFASLVPSFYLFLHLLYLFPLVLPAFKWWFTLDSSTSPVMKLYSFPKLHCIPIPLGVCMHAHTHICLPDLLAELQIQ